MIAFSIALQLAAVLIFYKIMVFNEFLFIKSKADSAIRLSVGLAPYNGVEITPASCALAIPSIGNDLSPLPGLDDHATIVYSNKLLMFTLTPAEGSARTHMTFYTGKMDDFSFTSTGQMLGFMYKSCGMRFSSIRHINSASYLQVAGPAVF